MTDLPIKIRGLSHPEIPLFDSVKKDSNGWISEAGMVINQEKAFIASSWCHKERSNPAYFWVSKKAFHHQFYLNVICMLVDARPDLFRIACNEDKPDQMLGWSCIEKEEGLAGVWYQCYIKEDFRDRGFGLQNELIPWCQLAPPKDFERLINDTRKNQVAESGFPTADVDPRHGISAATRSADQKSP